MIDTIIDLSPSPTARRYVKNYPFVDDSKTILEALESGPEMDELAEDRELVRSVVESEISGFLDG